MSFSSSLKKENKSHFEEESNWREAMDLLQELKIKKRMGRLKTDFNINLN